MNTPLDKSPDDPGKISLSAALDKSSSELSLEDRIISWQCHSAQDPLPTSSSPSSSFDRHQSISSPALLVCSEDPASSADGASNTRRPTSHAAAGRVGTSDSIPLTTANLQFATGETPDRRSPAWSITLRHGTISTIKKLGHILASPGRRSTKGIRRLRRGKDESSHPAEIFEDRTVDDHTVDADTAPECSRVDGADDICPDLNDEAKPGTQPAQDAASEVASTDTADVVCATPHTPLPRLASLFFEKFQATAPPRLDFSHMNHRVSSDVTYYSPSKTSPRKTQRESGHRLENATIAGDTTI